MNKLEKFRIAINVITDIAYALTLFALLFVALKFLP